VRRFVALVVLAYLRGAVFLALLAALLAGGES
jgi:hypothetical protein